jgi:plasmid stability protein
MAQIIVRDLDDDIKKRLQRRAKQHGLSMEAEVRNILRNAVAIETPETEPFGTRFSRHFSGIGLDQPIAELRGNIAQPATFHE